MDEEKTINWKEETEQEVMARLGLLYDAEANVYNWIFRELLMAGWKMVPTTDKRTRNIESPDRRYLFHFILFSEDGKPFFEVVTR